MKIAVRPGGVVLVVLVLLAAGLRLFKIEQRVVWYDEANSLLWADAGVKGAIEAAQSDVHPPLYYLLLYFWTRVSQAEVWARLFSVVMGVTAVVVVFFLGRLLAGEVAGFFSALFLAFCPMHIWYSQEIRMYTLQTVLVSLSYLFMILSLQENRGTYWTLYCIATALSLYTQYTSLLSLLAQNLFMIIFLKRYRPVLKQWALSQLSIAVLFLPCAVMFLHTLRTTTSAGGFWLGSLSMKAPAGFLALLSGFVSQRGSLPFSAAVSLVMLIVVAMLLLGRKDKPPLAVLVLFWFCVPLLVLALVSLKQNLFVPRTILYTAPAFHLAVGWAAAIVLDSRAKAGAMLVSIFLVALNLNALYGYYFLPSRWIKSPLRDVCRLIEREHREGDIVLHSAEYTYRPCQYYLADRVPQSLVTGTGALARADRVERIWVVLRDDPSLRAWMDAHHQQVGIAYDGSAYDKLWVGVYERRDTAVVPP